MIFPERSGGAISTSQGGYQKGRLLLRANAEQVDLDELMLLLPQGGSPPKQPSLPPRSPLRPLREQPRWRSISL
ncbi:MAG: hypothetical protein MPW15_17410 [Candidatus Manganitrophus sp.]|nr:hypothetical protein [Candidatus Manganitrophus sp.]